MNNLYPSILFRIFITYCTAIIWASIINQYQFKQFERLRKNAIHTFAQIRLNAKYGHYY